MTGQDESGHDDGDDGARDAERASAPGPDPARGRDERRRRRDGSARGSGDDGPRRRRPRGDTEIIDGTSPTRCRRARRAQRDEYLDSLRRLQAEFENYKKRVSKQQTDQVEPRSGVAGGEAAARCSTRSTSPPSTWATPTPTTARHWWRPPALLTACWPRRGSSASTRSGEPFDPKAHEAVGRAADDEPIEDGGRRRRTSRGHRRAVVGQRHAARVPLEGPVVRPAMVMVRG